MAEQEKIDYSELSVEETRKYVTPYAFGVADSLLGVPLASPTKRLLAITIDAILIGLLANVGGALLGLLIFIVSCISLFKLRRRKRRGFAKVSLSVIAAVSFLLLVLDASDWEYAIEKSGMDISIVQNDADTGDLIYQNDSVSPEFELAVDELANAEGDALCPNPQVCDERFFTQLMNDVVSQGYDKDDGESIFNGIKKLLDDSDRLSEGMDDVSFDSFLYDSRMRVEGLGAKAAFSVMRAANALMSDFGLGLGWAALYFSVFLAWWDGQTLGKILCGIRVIKIDGKGLDLWESFERYGGYGAGLATGLLGFLQVCWDANRQAIHDKISETVVIDLRKSERQKNSIK